MKNISRKIKGIVLLMGIFVGLFFLIFVVVSWIYDPDAYNRNLQSVESISDYWTSKTQ